MIDPKLLHGDGEKFGSTKHVQKLREAIRASRRDMDPFRINRKLAVQEFVGAHYSANGAVDKVPVNFIKLAVQVYTRVLAARNPKVMVKTDHFQLRSKAYDLSLGLNHLLEEIQFLKTLKRFVLDSFFGVGIIKVGIETKGQQEIDGAMHDIAQPYADRVSLDDFVVDMTATSFDDAHFVGHRFRVPLEWAKNNKQYSQKMREKLVAYDKASRQDDTTERTSEIGEDTVWSTDPYINRVELWEIYLPLEGKIVTMAAESSSDEEFLREQDYAGPEAGPYHFLGYQEVPDNVMPLPPVADWIDIHDLGNRMFRKLGRQGERQKDVVAYQGTAAEDAKRIVDANDGDTVRVDNPNNMKQLKFGGADRNNMAFAIWLKDIFNYLAGNLDLLGGLGASAETARQEQLIKNSGSVMIDEMKDRTMAAIRGVIHALAWYVWEDPLIELHVAKRVPGFEDSVSVPSKFTAEAKEGDFLQYNFQIEPYSMQPDTPESRLQTLNGVWMQFIQPMLPMLQEHGIQVNLEQMLRNIGRYSNMPEDLEGVLVYSDPGASPQRGPVGKPPAPKAGATKRTYERINTPGITQASKENTMVQSLLSGGGEGAGAEVA